MTAALALELPELAFEAGLPGFPEAHRFVLVRVDGVPEPFAALRSLDVDGLEFVVVPAAPFFPDYAPELSDEAASALRLSDADDALVLLILTIDAGSGSVSANLAGPVVVNVQTGDAAQVVLVDEDVRVPLPVPAAG